MESLLNFLLGFYGPAPYFFVFGILLLCGLGLPIPEDITLFVAGMLSYYGVTSLITMIIISFVGVLLGDSIIFALGAFYGRKMAQKWPFSRFLTPERLTEVKKRFHKRGNKLIFAARFMPGLRAPIFFSAGTLHLPFRVFFFYDGMAALISVPTIIGAVYYFGDEVDHVIRVIQKIEHGIAFVILAIFSLLVFKWYWSRRKKV